MNWFILALSCIIMWAVTDIFYKLSSEQGDPLSQYKTFVWVGIVMAVAGLTMCFLSDTLPNSVKMAKDDAPYIIPLCVVYATALFFGILGKKYLDASVVSPLENIDRALAAIIIYFYYLLTGYIHPSYEITSMDLVASAFVLTGVILLGMQEQALMRQEVHLSEDKRKHRLGALALFFPILYNLMDGFLIAENNGINGNSDVVSNATEVSFPAIDFFVFQCAGMVIVAVCIWLYMMFVKKYKYNPFKKEELKRCGAATGETLGTMTFIFASSLKPVVTAPFISSYCLVTIVLARIFLKERLSKKQYLSLAFLIVGIALLGISEIFNVY